MKFTFDFCGSIIMLERGGIMSTIFPREEKAEQIFDRILTNPNACERLKNTFFEAIPSAEESEGAGTYVSIKSKEKWSFRKKWTYGGNGRFM